jgi:hypothetical protein
MATTSLTPKIRLDGVQRFDQAESDAATGPAGPRLGSTSPRPERAARRQAHPGASTATAGLTTSFFDVSENAAQLQDRRVSMRRSSVSHAPWDSAEDFDCAHRPPAPVRRAHKVRAYTCGEGAEAQAIVSTMAITPKGDLLLWGDRSGRIFLLDREDGVVSRAGPFAALTKRQAYSPFVDPLHSVDVSPAVTASAFFPPIGPTAHFVTCNERIPKLWKVSQAPTTLAPAFRAVDMIGSRTVGPLTVAEPSVHCVELGKYNLDHEYNISSVLPNPDGRHFITVDDLTVRLWATEVTHMSMELISIRPPEGVEVRESFTVAASSPADPALILCCTTAGFVRVLDTRCSLRLSADNELQGAAMVFRNVQRHVDREFTQVSASILGACATPCGHYVLGRDLLTTQLWDVRMAAAPSPGTCSVGSAASPSAAELKSFVRRWALHPEVHRSLDDVYQAGIFFDRCPVGLIEDGRRWVTGSFGGRVVSASLGDDAATVTPDELLNDLPSGSPSEQQPGSDQGDSPYERRCEDASSRRAAVYLAAGACDAEPVSLGLGEVSSDNDAAGRTQVAVCSATGDIFAAIADVVHHVWLE